MAVQRRYFVTPKKAKTFLDELENFEPEMAKLSKEAYSKAKVESDFVWLDKASFEQIKGNSIDYAVMEKTKKGMIVKLNAGWDDVGSWNALYDISKKDENMNRQRRHPSCTRQR